MFPKFIQVGLHLRDVYAGGALLFEILIGFHIWGAYIPGAFYTGCVLTGFYVILKFSLFLCNKRPIFYYVNSVCFETITYKVLIIFKNAIKVNQLRFNKNFPILKNRLTFFTSTVNILI